MFSALRRLCTALVLSAVATSASRAQGQGGGSSVVLTLSEFKCAPAGTDASVLWFAVPAAPSARGRRLIAMYVAAGRQAVEPGPPLWVPIDGDTMSFVVPIREDGSNVVALIDEASDLLAQAAAAAHTAGLDRAGIAARLSNDLRRIVPSVRPSEAGGNRLIGVTELRVTDGDLATARVGLVAAKELRFQADGASCRMAFQLLRSERFLRSVSPP